MMPAAEMGIEHLYLAWCFDQAVSSFGLWVESKLSERDKKGKPKHRLETLLGIPIRTRKITMAEIGQIRSN